MAMQLAKDRDRRRWVIWAPGPEPKLDWESDPKPDSVYVPPLDRPEPVRRLESLPSSPAPHPEQLPALTRAPQSEPVHSVSRAVRSPGGFG